VPPQQSAEQDRAGNNQLGLDLAPYKPSGRKHSNRDEDAEIEPDKILSHLAKFSSGELLPVFS
jgi:hypothetical protein